MPIKRLTEYQLGFSVPVGGSEVQKSDAGVDRLVHGSYGFITVSRAPNLPDAATPKSKAAYLTQLSERSLPHN
jgi:hypothetical protein